MTAIVGVLCKDGVVIGSDSATTFAAGPQRTIEQPSKKIRILKDSAIIAGTGSVGLGQRFCHEIESRWDVVLPNPPTIIVNQLCAAAIGNFRSTGLAQFEYGALMAFFHSDKFHLCEFEVRSLQPEFKTDHLWYVSTGSGQTIADPFLGFVRNIFWNNQQPDLKNGIFGTLWALQHTINVNPGGVNGPIQLSILSKNGDAVEAKILDDGEIDEHLEYVREFENHLKDFKRKLTSAPKEIPKYDVEE
ncbi:hypothetical protein V1387_00760 [Allomuricauda taeanensis]|uniref:hypothetical protein n=1 Tax=Flagellimonas taeanensis TaxID=1005926 RepID=UPI002E7B83D2|nr:hypothetical protein [Allomuricauda taeanensis]MEE1961193.1 hypothetical protein [Allomuricauda taeanensis]